MRARSPRSTYALAARASPPMPSARPFCEQPESDNPANDALDRIEEGVRQVLAAGGEFALRQRLARLLPSIG